MFVTDILVAIPLFPILILFYFVMRANMSAFYLALMMASFGWPFDARLIRSIALGLRNREFTRHAVFAGMSPARTMFQEHLPYVMPIVFASTINNMIWSIGLEVTLAVLGLHQPDRPDRRHHALLGQQSLGDDRRRLVVDPHPGDAWSSSCSSASTCWRSR